MVASLAQLMIVKVQNWHFVQGRAYVQILTARFWLCGLDTFFSAKHARLADTYLNDRPYCRPQDFVWRPDHAPPRAGRGPLSRPATALTRVSGGVRGVARTTRPTRPLSRPLHAPDAPSTPSTRPRRPFYAPREGAWRVSRGVVASFTGVVAPKHAPHTGCVFPRPLTRPP